MRIPRRRQENPAWCGPATVQMVLAAFGIVRSQQALARALRTRNGSGPRDGTSNNALATIFRRYGLKSKVLRNARLSDVARHLGSRAVVVVNFIEAEFNEGHFGVLLDVSPTHVRLVDPWVGRVVAMKRSDFNRRWTNELKTIRHWAVIVSQQ